MHNHFAIQNNKNAINKVIWINLFKLSNALVLSFNPFNYLMHLHHHSMPLQYY
jgi:hypothetical protein